MPISQPKLPLGHGLSHGVTSPVLSALALRGTSVHSLMREPSFFKAIIHTGYTLRNT